MPGGGPWQSVQLKRDFLTQEDGEEDLRSEHVALVNSSSVYIHAKSSISSSVNGFITFLGLHGDNGLFDLTLFAPGDAAGINNGLDGLDLSLGELRAGVATFFGAGLCFEDAFLCGEDGTGGLVEGELGSFSTMSSSLDFLFLLRLRFLLRPLPFPSFFVLS